MRGAILLVALLWFGPVEAKPQNGVVPAGQVVFCIEQPAQCETLSASIPIVPVRYSDWSALLDRINRQVNSSITYTDEPIDHWDINPILGDCDDYALTKRAELIKAGFPQGALQFAFVKLPDQEGHVVLLINTDEGYKVLDNNSAEIYDLPQMVITRLSIQDARNPRIWRQQF